MDVPVTPVMKIFGAIVKTLVVDARGQRSKIKC